MTDPHDPLLVEIEPSACDSAMAAFIGWAGIESGVRLSYTPEVVLAIDTSERRGWLYDEVYFVTVWIDRGAADFRKQLESGLPEGCWSEKAPEQEPDPDAFLRAAIASGNPIEHGHHLG